MVSSSSQDNVGNTSLPVSDGLAQETEAPKVPGVTNIKELLYSKDSMNYSMFGDPQLNVEDDTQVTNSTEDEVSPNSEDSYEPEVQQELEEELNADVEQEKQQVNDEKGGSREGEVESSNHSEADNPQNSEFNLGSVGDNYDIPANPNSTENSYDKTEALAEEEYNEEFNEEFNVTKSQDSSDEFQFTEQVNNSDTLYSLLEKAETEYINSGQEEQDVMFDGQSDLANSNSPSEAPFNSYDNDKDLVFDSGDKIDDPPADDITSNYETQDDSVSYTDTDTSDETQQDNAPAEDSDTYDEDYENVSDSTDTKKSKNILNGIIIFSQDGLNDSPSSQKSNTDENDMGLKEGETIDTFEVADTVNSHPAFEVPDDDNMLIQEGIVVKDEDEQGIAWALVVFGIMTAIIMAFLIYRYCFENKTQYKMLRRDDFPHHTERNKDIRPWY